MRPMPAAAVLLALAALAGPAPAHAARVRDWTKSWNVAGAPVVRIVTDDATVRIRRGEPGVVKAHVHFSARAWGMSSGVKEPRVVLEQAKDAIRIEARERSHWVVFGGIETKYTIDVTVPANCDLSARTTDGGITCEPLEGRVSLETGDGRIRANGLKGTLVLWSGDGSIDADSLDGSLMARTTDGRLKVGGRFDHLDLRTGDGRLEATVLRGSQPGGPWSLETGEGPLLLRIPRDLRAMLDAASREGPLKVELPIETKGAIRNHALAGALNGGAVPLRLRSGDGSITIALSE